MSKGSMSKKSIKTKEIPTPEKGIRKKKKKSTNCEDPHYAN
jgi:hypothetical protein